MSILEKNSKLDPFFHKMTYETKCEKLMILKKENKNIGDLYDVEYKIYHYYNEKGEIKKSISKPINKKFIKQLEKTQFDKNFVKNCMNIFCISGLVEFCAIPCVFALLSICPPQQLVLVQFLWDLLQG